MTEFEKLKEIAEKEFGVTLIQGDKKSSFKELFGFDIKDLEEKIKSPYRLRWLGYRPLKAENSGRHRVG